MKSSLRLCSPPHTQILAGEVNSLEINALFVAHLTIRSLSLLCFCRKTSTYTCTHSLNCIFPVKTLRGSIATLSKKNMHNDGCIKQFIYLFIHSLNYTNHLYGICHLRAIYKWSSWKSYSTYPWNASVSQLEVMIWTDNWHREERRSAEFWLKINGLRKQHLIWKTKQTNK